MINNTVSHSKGMPKPVYVLGFTELHQTVTISPHSITWLVVKQAAVLKSVSCGCSTEQLGR